MIFRPVAVNKIWCPISDVDSDLSEVKTHTTTIFDLEPYLLLSYIIERHGIDCDNMPLGDALRHEVLWSYEIACVILSLYRQVNFMALVVKDF